MLNDFGFKSGVSIGQTSPLTTKEPVKKIKSDEA
jgi:hypothetical protein